MPSRGLRITSTAPASSACISVSEPCSVSDEHMTTGIGRCAISLRRKVMPSMRGISTSSMITSGSSFWMRRAATNGSDAVPITAISGSLPSIVGQRLAHDRRVVDDQHLHRRLHGARRNTVLADRAQRQIHAGERFRMAQEQEAAGAQVLAQPLQHRMLGRLVEIDQHVAAEDHVEVAVDWVALIHQVQPHEFDPGAQFRHDPHQSALAVAAAQQIALAELRRHRRDHRLGIDRALRHIEHLGGQIGPQDRDAQAAPLLAPVGQHHGERVGLRAGGAGGTPQLDLRLPAGVAIRQQGGQRLRTRKRKCSGSRKKSVLLVVTASIRCTASVRSPSRSNSMWQ